MVSGMRPFPSIPRVSWSRSVSQTVKFPNSWSGHKTLTFRKTRVEWLLHHGHGVRQGHLGVTRENPDWEYSDGTPAPITLKRFATKHFFDSVLVQIIRAGATVEKATRLGTLPRIPGTKEQRSWDPEIPLFLDDSDEHGEAPSDLASIRRQLLDQRFAKPKKEEMEVNTLFASYDPAAFVSEPVVDDRKKQRPKWSRRRWALSNQFTVPKDIQSKNTIPDTS